MIYLVLLTRNESLVVVVHRGNGEGVVVWRRLNERPSGLLLGLINWSFRGEIQVWIGVFECERTRYEKRGSETVCLNLHRLEWVVFWSVERSHALELVEISRVQNRNCYLKTCHSGSALCGSTMWVHLVREVMVFKRTRFQCGKQGQFAKYFLREAGGAQHQEAVKATKARREAERGSGTAREAAKKKPSVSIVAVSATPVLSAPVGTCTLLMAAEDCEEGDDAGGGACSKPTLGDKCCLFDDRGVFRCEVGCHRDRHGQFCGGIGDAGAWTEFYSLDSKRGRTVATTSK